MYEGEWLENVMDGQGVFIDEFGNLYEGQFINDQFEGRGRMINQDGVFEGNWENGMRSGYGNFRYTNGDRYDGVVKLRWLGILGSIGYDLAIVIDRLVKKTGYNFSLSKYLKNNVKAAISFMVDFENEMVRQAKKVDCHTVVCGHIHSPIDKNIDGVRYLNTGDWIENCSYITYYSETGNFKLCKNYSSGSLVQVCF